MTVRVPARPAVLLGAALAAAAAWSVLPAAAADPAPGAVCVEVGGPVSDRSRAELQGWMNEQLAAGRDEFMPLTVAGGATFGACAW